MEPIQEPAAPAQDALADKKNKEGLRTYASDFGHSISGEKGDIIRRAIAEEARRKEIEKSMAAQSKQNIWFLLGSILAIGLGLLALGYLVFASRTKTIEPVKNTVASVVAADASKEISVDSIRKEQLVAAIQAEQKTKAADGIVKNIFFTETRGGIKYLSGPKNFLKIIESSAPELLTDGLNTTFMFGVYNSSGKNVPFIILKTNVYNDAFSGMRAWESRLFDDTYQIFSIATGGDNSNLFEAKFEDATMKNKDARVLRNTARDISLLYAFADEHTIVITTDGAALDEVQKRLTSQKIEQSQP